jgi:hypothetical protein
MIPKGVFAFNIFWVSIAFDIIWVTVDIDWSLEITWLLVGTEVLLVRTEVLLVRPGVLLVRAKVLIVGTLVLIWTSRCLYPCVCTCGLTRQVSTVARVEVGTVGTVKIRVEVVVVVVVAAAFERLIAGWLESRIHCCKPEGVLHHETKGARTPMIKDEKKKKRNED